MRPPRTLRLLLRKPLLLSPAPTIVGETIATIAVTVPSEVTVLSVLSVVGTVIE